MQSVAPPESTVESLTTCGYCGRPNDVIDMVEFLLSDADRTSLITALAEAIVSRPALYDQLLNSGAYAGEVRKAAELISGSGLNSSTAEVSSSLPLENNAASIEVKDVLPEWSALPPSSSFDGVIPDNDVSPNQRICLLDSAHDYAARIFGNYTTEADQNLAI